MTSLECLSTLNGEGFYQRMGFATLHKRDVTLGTTPFPSILMRTRLA